MAAQNNNANDITSVISSLASRQSNRAKAAKLAGPKSSLILMRQVGEQYG